MSDSKSYFGIYRGTVASNRDPLNKNRLKLSVPLLLGDVVTEWAWPIEPAQIQSAPPVVGQGVWVMFEGGDQNYPLWAGHFGTHLGKGYEIQVNELAKGSYPATITRHISGSNFDVIAAIADLAAKVDEIRLSLNAHGGGDTEASPSDVSP